MSRPVLEPPSWKFVGAVVLLLVGLLGGVVSAAGLTGHLPNRPDAEAVRPQFWLGVVATVAAFVGGSQLAARSSPGSMFVVFLFIAPVPAVIALLFSAVGDYLRTGRSAGVLRAVLAGLGVFLLALAGQWLLAGCSAFGAADGPRSTLWVEVVGFGLSALLLAVTPGSEADEPVALKPAAG